MTFRPIGVWGDTNQSAGVGVLATADFGIAIAAYNNAENISTAKFQNDENTDEVGNVLATKGGHFGGICVMDVGGNLRLQRQQVGRSSCGMVELARSRSMPWKRLKTGLKTSARRSSRTARP